MRALLLAVPLLATSCVTSGDLLRLETRFDQIQSDGIVTEAERDELQAEIADVAQEVEDRTTNSLEALAGTGGVTGLLTAFGLNLYRNSRRKRRGEPVAVPYGGPQDTVPPGGQNPG